MNIKLFSVILLCLGLSLLHTSCKKDDITRHSRVYFTYQVGHFDQQQSQCLQGDGVCAMEVMEPSWRPGAALAEGYGFGYITMGTDLKLKMVIYMPFMDAQTYRDHYADGVANLPGPWKLAIELTTKLGIIDGYTVSMGDYKVGLDKEDGYDVLVISF